MTRRSGGRAVLILAALLTLAVAASPAQGAVHRPPSDVPGNLNETIETAHFVVHYTTAAGDPNASTADHARALADAGERGYAVEVGQWGFPAPLDDGDGKTDIYVYVTSHAGLAAPDTSREQTSGSILYGVRTSAGHIPHEFFHLIQFAIYRGESGSWLAEASADWAAVGVAGQYRSLPAAFRIPHVPLDCRGTAPTDCGGDRYAYHGNVFLELVSERFGGPAVIREMFEHAAVLGAGNKQSHSIQAVSETLAAHGTSLEAAFNDYVIANQAGSYSFPGLGSQRPRPESVRFIDPGEHLRATIRVDHLAEKYIAFTSTSCAKGTLRITVTVPGGVPAAPAIVTAARTVVPTPSGVPTDIPVTSCDIGTLVLPNPSTTTNAAGFAIDATLTAPPARPPRLTKLHAGPAHLGRKLHFSVRASGGGRFTAKLSPGSITTKGRLRSGKNRLTLHLPRGLKPGRHRLTVVPYSSGGAKGKAVTQTVSVTP